MSRIADRAAARREGRIRRAELRLFAGARAYAATLERSSSAAVEICAGVELAAELTATTAAARPELQAVIGALSELEAQALRELEAAALHFANVAPPASRRRRSRR